jgi:hypothetical protein
MMTMLIKINHMPTIHRERGYRFYFNSNENNEPAHVHVKGKEGRMKV